MRDTATRAWTVPETSITVHENPDDPWWVTAYSDERPGSTSTAHIREAATGEFRYLGSFQSPLVSPGGTYAISLPLTRFTALGDGTIRIIDRRSGVDGEISTAEGAGHVYHPAWDRERARVILSVYEGDNRERLTGFVAVDARARTAAFTPVSGGDTGFTWGPDPTTLMQGSGATVRYLDLSGKVVRSFTGVGQMQLIPATHLTVGTVFTTLCPDDPREVCLWDTSTGNARGRVPLGEGMTFNGYLGDRHVMVTEVGRRATRVLMLDLRGAVVRVLAEGPADEFRHITLWYSARSA